VGSLCASQFVFARKWEFSWWPLLTYEIGGACELRGERWEVDVVGEGQATTALSSCP